MIPFLVKLANLLDERGQHAMAREVDDLIGKIAQNTTWLDSWIANNKKLAGLLVNLKELAALSGNKRASQVLDSSIEWANNLSKENVTNETVDQGNQWWDYLGTNVFKPLEAAIESGKLSGGRYYQIKEQMTPILNDIAQYSGNVRDMLPKQEEKPGWLNPKEQTGVASKAPATPKKHQPSKRTMDTIRLIQNAIGANVNGKWDAATNAAFIKYMNENYPVAMQNNRFVGPVVDDKGTRGGNTLADAWELIKEKDASQQQLAQEMANKPPAEQTEQASKAPAVKPVAAPSQWKSKFFKITPQLQALLSQWEAARGKGTGQTLLDAFDRSPGQTQQSLEQFITENMNA